MEQPELLVNDSQRTTTWIQKHIQYYQQLSYGNSAQKRNDEVCWEYYNNKTDVSKFEYLTSMGNYHLPSQIRHIPLQRTNCDLLISLKTRRPFVWDCFAMDNNSLKEKRDMKIQAIANIMRESLNRKYHEDITKIAQIDEQIAQIQQTLQTKPQSQEEAQQIEALRQRMPQIMQQYSYIKDQLKYTVALTEEEEEELKILSKNTKKDWKESIAINAAKKLRRVLNIDNESSKNFQGECVLGRGAFYVDMEPGDKYPKFKAMNMIKVYYPKIDGIDWIQDCPWAKIEEGKSYQQIVTVYGTEIVKKYGQKKLQDLQDLSNIENGTFVSTPTSGAMYVDKLYTGSSLSNQNIVEEKIFFKVPRKIKVKYSPNKFVMGEYFRKFLDGTKEVINEDEYKYDHKNACYINKANKEEVYSSDQVETYKPSSGQQLMTYYMNDIYKGVIINRDIFLSMGKKQCILRDPDYYPNVKLPIYGRTHAGINDQPYSIIRDTINLQDMFDLVNYYRDLMFALSGPKTILYDRSFKPTNMTDEEWEYQKKVGTLYIQTFDKATGQRNPSTFNQFSMFDMTLSPAIQYFEPILQSIKETMGDVVGTPRQRKGEVVSTDQVGTYEMSIKQASLVTEIRYDKHDEVESKAFEAAINLYLRYCLKENDLLEVIGKDFSMDVKKITKGLFDNVKIEVMVANNSEQERTMAEMKEISMLGLKSGAVQYDSIVKTFLESNNLVEFKNKVEYYSNEAKKLAQENAGALESQKAAIVEKAEKLRQEYEGFWKQKELESKSFGDKILAENNRVQNEIMAKRNQIEREKNYLDSAIKMLEISAEDKIETGLLQESKDARIAQQKLEAIRTQLDALITTMDIKSADKEHDQKHIETNKKLAIDKMKVKGNKYEHLID